MGRGVHLPEESGGQAETKQSADGSISGLPLDRLRLVALLAVRSLGTGVADSDDVAQQTVIQILRRRDTLGRLPERELVAYVRKASRMHLLKLRRGSKRRATREEEWSRAQEWTGARPDELVDDNDVATKRLRLLAALPAELFRLISACDLSGEPLERRSV